MLAAAAVEGGGGQSSLARSCEAGLRFILLGLRMEEGRGIPSVEVKFVDIGKNTGGEGGNLAHY